MLPCVHRQVNFGIFYTSPYAQLPSLAGVPISSRCPPNRSPCRGLSAAPRDTSPLRPLSTSCPRCCAAPSAPALAPPASSASGSCPSTDEAACKKVRQNVPFPALCVTLSSGCHKAPRLRVRAERERVRALTAAGAGLSPRSFCDTSSVRAIGEPPVSYLPHHYQRQAGAQAGSRLQIGSAGRGDDNVNVCPRIGE